jgi:hypothetical protein
MQRVRDGSNGGRRDENHDDRQAKDRPELAPKVAERVCDRTRVEERWDEYEEQNVRRQRDLRQPWDEREEEPADDEHSGVRNGQPLSDEPKSSRDSKEKQNELEAGQGCSRK